MSKKIRNLCLSLALGAVVAFSASASACTTKSKHPNAKITISFNEQVYEIEYTLYRNMYPQTVQHFIELADAGFYDNTIVHNYSASSDWLAGGYSYDKDDYSAAFESSLSNSSPLTEYLEDHSKEKEYYDLVTAGIQSGAFSASVYTTSRFVDGKEVLSLEDALPTLIGEFSDNAHTIKDDKGLTASYGTLKMIYNKKEGYKKVQVQDSFDAILTRDYCYNCATSLFAMQMSSSTTYSASSYCVFGQLKNDKSKSKIEELTDAITDYATNLSASSALTKSVATQVDREDKFADEGGREIDASFTMISMPIVIVKVEITKH